LQQEQRDWPRQASLAEQAWLGLDEQVSPLRLAWNLLQVPQRQPTVISRQRQQSTALQARLGTYRELQLPRAS